MRGINTSIRSVKIAGLGGVSWETDSTEKEIANHIITFLENKRVLFSPLSIKCERGVIESIAEIRNTIQSILEGAKNRNTTVFEMGAKIRDAAIHFLEYACQDCNAKTCEKCKVYKKGCVLGLQAFRAEVRDPIAKICKDYDLEANDNISRKLISNGKAEPESKKK